MVSRYKRTDRGFTLVELLVVIGIIAILISLLLPTLSRVKRQALFTQCGANLHDIGLSLLNYAAVNKGDLPQFNANPTAQNPSPDGGYWLWDMEVGFRDAIARYGAQRNNLYCPVQHDTQNVDALWEFRVSDATSRGYGNGLPDNADGSLSGYVVFGYFFLISRPDVTYPIVAVPSWQYQKRIIPDNSTCNYPAKQNISSETEVVTDAVCDDGTGKFGNVKGGYKINGNQVPNQSAHWFGGLPLGGNILYLDGHVSNRNFKKSSIPGAGADPLNTQIMHYRCSPGNYAGVRFFF